MLRDGNLSYNPAVLTLYRRLTDYCARSRVHDPGEAHWPAAREPRAGFGPAAPRNPIAPNAGGTLSGRPFQ